MEQNKENFRKGSEAEIYCTHRLSELGYSVLYVGGCQSFSINGNYFSVVDLQAYKNGKTFSVQVKFKQPRNTYPDTGMEEYRYNNMIDYYFATGLPILVLFIENDGKMYGEWLHNLQMCQSPHGAVMNTKNNKKMIYWLISHLKDYRLLV